LIMHNVFLLSVNETTAKTLQSAMKISMVC
jgi:hypothetical protein